MSKKLYQLYLAIYLSLLSLFQINKFHLYTVKWKTIIHFRLNLEEKFEHFKIESKE